MTGNGDLWPSCWAEDDNLYAANGDGKGFGKVYTDMAVSRISGAPRKLTGTHDRHQRSVPTGAAVSIPANRRELLCRGGAIYLAFQNLNESTFDDAPQPRSPNPSITEPLGLGMQARPMFGTPSNAASPKAYKFTTIFFLDYGQDSANAIDGYVYAYASNNNWRSQEAMFLGRVPAEKVQTRASWEFYAAQVRMERPSGPRTSPRRSRAHRHPPALSRSCSDRIARPTSR